MKAKRMPETRLRPARDPLLDESPWQVARSEIRRWAVGIALALGLALAGSIANGMDAQSTVAAQAVRLDERTQELERLQRTVARREAEGNCSTLFYLVEADGMEAAGEKLLQASMRMSAATNAALYPAGASRKEAP
jgi:hypothetical protein